MIFFRSAKSYVIVLSIVSLFLTSCYTTFTVTKDNLQAKKSSKIAVIAGNNLESNLSMAILVTEELKKLSKFKVLSQREIKNALRAYPVRIQGPWSRAYFEIDEDFKRTDIEKIKAIQKRLGVDYLFVLWMPVSIQNQVISGGSVYDDTATVCSICQMFKFPGAEEIGKGNFTMRSIKGYSGATKKDIMDYFSNKIASDISEEMNMKR